MNRVSYRSTLSGSFVTEDDGLATVTRRAQECAGDPTARGPQPRPSDAVLSHDVRMEWYDASSAPPAMRAAARPYEERFNLAFNRYCFFQDKTLRRLHAQRARNLTSALNPSLTVVSDTEPGVLESLESMTVVANLPSPSLEDRRSYLDGLLRVYAAFPVTNAEVASQPGVFSVAPRREGHLLASLTGALPDTRSASPHVKRIPFQGGLLIGMSDVTALTAEVVLLIDGAIATAATLLSLVAAVADGSPTRIHAVHGTSAGLSALLNFAWDNDLPLEIIVGHVSGSLDDHFYARVCDNPTLLVVGDVGDIIAPLFEGHDLE